MKRLALLVTVGVASCRAGAPAQDATRAAERKTCAWSAALDAPSAAPRNHRVLFENERVRVLDVVVEVGGRESLHAHCCPSFLYVMFRGKLREWGADGKLIREVNETPPATAFPITQLLQTSPPHSIENLDSQPIHLLRVELKQYGYAAAQGAEQAIRGFAHLERAGTLHSDIRPANIAELRGVVEMDTTGGGKEVECDQERLDGKE